MDVPDGVFSGPQQAHRLVGFERSGPLVWVTVRLRARPRPHSRAFSPDVTHIEEMLIGQIPKLPGVRGVDRVAYYYGNDARLTVAHAGGRIQTLCFALDSDHKCFVARFCYAA